LLSWVCEQKFRKLSVLAKKTTSGRMFGCYILCNESRVEVARLAMKVKGRGGSTKQSRSQSDQQQVEEINRQEVDKRSCGNRLKTKCRLTGS
jgi:hypothetical protein